MVKIFLNEDVVYKDAVKLFYANMFVVDASDPTIQSLVLGTQIEFNLEHLYQILNLPKLMPHGL